MTRVSFAVVITNDNVLEGDEKFNLTIVINSFFPSYGVTVSNPDHVTVTIYDDDGNLILNLYAIAIHLLVMVHEPILILETNRVTVTTGTQLDPSVPLYNLCYI